MKFWRIVLITTIFIGLLAGETVADMIRFRLLVPVSEGTTPKTEDTPTTTQEVSTPPITIGYSAQLVIYNLGIGSTELGTGFQRKVKLKESDNDDDTLFTETTIVTANFWDLALTYGENFSITAGGGLLQNGKIEVAIDYGGVFEEAYAVTDETIKSVLVSGTASFVTVGFSISFFEIIVGQRWNSIIGTLDKTGTSLENLEDRGVVTVNNRKVKLNTSQTLIGLGFVF